MSAMKIPKLAMDGGPKAIDSIEGKGQPKIGHEEFLAIADTWGYSPATIERIRAAIEGENLGNGPFLNRYYNPRPSKVTQLEKECAELLGVKHVYAVSNCTGALNSAYVAADIGCGDEVIVSAYTFFATAAAAVVARGVPVWAEVDESMTVDPADIERKITPRTKAIAPVHMNGYVCNMDAVMEIARKHKLRVIEDCAQAFGCSFRGRRVGSMGDLGCFSISSYKVIGGGEGGLVSTHSSDLLARVQNWAECGGLWRPDRFGPPRWKGEVSCGLNFRMSELEGTVNLIQVRKSDAQQSRWRANKRRIVDALPAYKGLKPQKIHDLDGEMGHSLGALPGSIGEAEKLAGALRAEGVDASTRGSITRPDWHYAEDMWQVNQQMAATSDGCPWTCPKVIERGGPPPKNDNPCPRTADLTRRLVRISINQWWTEGDCAKVTAAIAKVFDAYYTRDPQTPNWRIAVTR